jgi:quercetin dioxygenase-like cupin family protein
MELLAFGALQMQAMLFRISPQATSGGSYKHEGEEFIYMLSGKFEIWLDEVERYVLERGDSLYFLSTQAHRWRGLGSEEAVLLWINSPPTF